MSSNTELSDFVRHFKCQAVADLDLFLRETDTILLYFKWKRFMLSVQISHTKVQTFFIYV